MARADSSLSTNPPVHLRLAAVDGRIVVSQNGDIRSHVDYELMLLQGELQAACNALTDALTNDETDTAIERMGEIASRIATTPARSLAGLRVKAAALQWTHLGQGYFSPLDFESSEGRLFISMLNDLNCVDAGAA